MIIIINLINCRYYYKKNLNASDAHSIQQYIYNRMAITTQEQKQNRKFYVPIRQGNRGGWSLFQWQSVREMPYRDREMYLGNSAVIGVLDKGGKWRKRDWYLRSDKRHNDPNLPSEQQQAIRKDQQRMNRALGRTQIDDEEHLTEQQMQMLLKKIRQKDGSSSATQTVGLGFDKTKIQIRAKPTVKIEGANHLAGINQLQQLQKEEEGQYSRQIRIRKQKKKQKKQKKEKKSKKEKREHSRSRDKQKQRKHKKAHKQDNDRSQSHGRKQKRTHKQKRTKKDGSEEAVKSKSKDRHHKHGRHEKKSRVGSDSD